MVPKHFGLDVKHFSQNKSVKSIFYRWSLNQLLYTTGVKTHIIDYIFIYLLMRILNGQKSFRDGEVVTFTTLDFWNDNKNDCKYMT